MDFEQVEKKKFKTPKKGAAKILGNFRPRKNSLTCHFFIYEAILAIFFCFVCFDEILLYNVSKVHLCTKPRHPMHINFRWCEGGHALTCGLPVFYLKCFFLLIIW